jgi:hypothetical protein
LGQLKGGPNKVDQRKKNMTKKDSKENVGTLGALFGQPVTAVLRRLGKEGISTAQARAICKAMKVKVVDTTVQFRLMQAGTRTRTGASLRTSQPPNCMPPLVL